MTRPLSSLRSRVFAAATVVAVLPVASTLLFLTGQLTREAEAELGRGVAEAARLVAQYHRARIELASERASLVADLPKLKAAVAEADPRTIEPVARDYRERLRSDVFVVAGRDRRTLVALGVPSWTGWSGERRYRVDQERLLEGVEAPILLGSGAPELLGYLTLAFSLDDAFLSRLRALSGSELAIVHEGRVYASTLPHGADAALVGAASGTALTRVRLGAEEYLALPTALDTAGDGPRALVLRSRTAALGPLRTLRSALLLAALAAVAVGVLLSWAVSRTVTRPLAALSATMRAIAATGDLARRLPPPHAWDDEDAQVLSRTFGALTESIARFQREAATRDRLSALGRLSTVIAHEVRNPLMIIKGSLRALRQQDARAEDLREAAADIDREVARLDRIVADVLDFARPLRLEPSRVDTASLLREAARAALQGADHTAVRFALDVAAPPVETDSERLRAVIVNLIQNARDGAAALRGKDAVETGRDAIEVGSRGLSSGGALLWVADRGAGITEADLPHVFEPYFTTKRTGTGLGLAIARKVVEALGGTIRLTSHPGEGTRVEIELPAALATGREAR